MKAQQPFFYKDGPVKYVRRIKAAYTLFSALFIVAFMVLLVFAFNGSDVGKPVFFSVAAVLLIGYFISYGFYTSRVTLGTVLGIETTDLVVHLHTLRKTYTYDVHMGCVGVREYKNRFVAVFETQDSRDSFIFYKHAPLSSYSDGQFTLSDIARFASGSPESSG